MSAAPLLPFPRLGIDPTSLPIGPLEAFVLSQVDGTASITDIALCTGQNEEQVEHILLRLEQLGAIRFEAPQAPPRSGSLPPPSPQSPSSSTRTRDQRPSFDPALLDEPGEIDRALKAEILEFHVLVEQANHYELLGVPSDADKKAIKAAYFERVNVFHTDRFFGKDLGAFKARLERILAALTKAHDTLTRSIAKQEYDKYLESRQATHGVRNSLEPRISSQHSASFIQETPVIPRAPRSPNWESEELTPLELEPTSSSPPPRVSTPPVSPPRSVDSTQAHFSPAPPSVQPSVLAQPPSSPVPPSSGNSSLRAPDPAAARKLLAKKFGHRNSLVAPPPSVSSQAQVKQAVSEQLRARFDARQGQNETQASRYVAMAQESRKNREWSSALNHLRLAKTFLPEDPELTALLQEVQTEADRALADQFIEQAKYEEADGHLERAARSFERAARGKSTGSQSDQVSQLFERAAHCLLEARGDRRKIVELARLGVQYGSARVSARLALARAYEFAEMRTSALGEISRALEIEPKNEEARTLQKQLK